MAKAKTNPAEAPVVETPVTTEGEALASASSEGAKKSATSYEVVSLPTNREKLSPQLKALVEAVDENTEVVNGKNIVFRARLLAKWSEKIGSNSADKVFASYMHQLLSFAFLDRMDKGTGTPKKIISPAERKAKLLEMIKKLPKEDQAELLAGVGAAE